MNRYLAFFGLIIASVLVSGCGIPLSEHDVQVQYGRELQRELQRSQRQLQRMDRQNANLHHQVRKLRTLVAELRARLIELRASLRACQRRLRRGETREGREGGPSRVGLFKGARPAEP